jgi:hypothetical protein
VLSFRDADGKNVVACNKPFVSLEQPSVHDVRLIADMNYICTPARKTKKPGGINKNLSTYPKYLLTIPKAELLPNIIGGRTIVAFKPASLRAKLRLSA